MNDMKGSEMSFENPADHDMAIVLPQASVEVNSPSARHVTDPRSVLPAHLQGRSFESDLWRRVSNSALPNPTLSSRKLNSDAESREIVRQVILAADEREKEVLLHSQARLFGAILGRAVGAIGVFLKQPLVPEGALRGLLGSRTSTTEPGAPITDAVRQPERKAVSGFDAPKLISKLLTPKYVLLILSAFLTIATGYSRLQVKNLEDAIKSYQAAAGATDDLKGKLETELAAMKSDKESDKSRIDGQITDLNAQLIAAQTSAREAEIRTAEAEKENELIKKESAKMGADLKSLHDQQSGDIKAVQAKLDDLQQKYQADETALAKAQVELAADAEWKTSMLATSDTREALLAKQAIELDALHQQISTQLNKIGELGIDRTLLGFAETCIQNVSGEAGSHWHDMDKNKVLQWVKEFESAKSNLRR